jgi:phosphoribosylformylglycinamidine (FGAM) synthase-like enzyme
LQAQDLQRRWTSRRPADKLVLFAMIRNTPQRARAMMVGAGQSWSSRARWRGASTPPDGLPTARDEATHVMKVETHNHPTAIALFPAPRRDRAERSATKALLHGRQAQGRPHRLHRLHRIPPRAAMGVDTASLDRISSALDIIEGRQAASFNNESGRPNLPSVFSDVRAVDRRRSPRLSSRS